MGAQMMQAVSELCFTASDDSILITLYNGKVIELFGDGFVQQSITTDAGHRSIVDGQITG